MAFGGGNIAGSKQLDPSHNNNKAPATHLSSWTYSTAIPSIEIEVGRVIKVPAPHFRPAGRRGRGPQRAAGLMKRGSIPRCLSSSTRMAIVLGPKQRPIIPPDFVSRAFRSTARAGLRMRMQKKRRCHSLEGQWMTAPATHQRLRHSFWLAKPKEGLIGRKQNDLCSAALRERRNTTTLSCLNCQAPESPDQLARNLVQHTRLLAF